VNQTRGKKANQGDLRSEVIGLADLLTRKLPGGGASVAGTPSLEQREVSPPMGRLGQLSNDLVTVRFLVQSWAQ
jgi:hypothetical protein